MTIYGIKEAYYDMEEVTHYRIREKLYRKKKDAETEADMLNRSLDDYERLNYPFTVIECELI